MKKDLIEIETLISKMLQNTFLLPDGWSETIEMTHEEWSYRTYVSDTSRGLVGRYVNLEIYHGNKKIHEIQFRGAEVKVEVTLGKKVLTTKEVLNYVQTIYKELHSFEKHNDVLISTKKKLTEALNQKNQIDKEIERLRRQIKDAIQINKN